jgi:methylenetetrahydrofolate reductase (NADPH)
MSTPGMAAAPTVSFEFFPPNDPEMEQTLWASVARLEALAPQFVSVTYGADGSTRERTFSVVTRIAAQTSLVAVPHLTCVGARREEILAVARRYWDAGLRHVVALRGDPAAGATAYTPVAGGFDYAADLVAGLRAMAGFEISVAGYPETHPEASSADEDIAALRRKVDAGATRVLTQFFFAPDSFLRYRDRCAAAGIAARVVPGILPVNRFDQVRRFARRCGATIPAPIARRFAEVDADAAAHRQVAVEVAVELVTRLQREGVDAFHFYTLNRAELTEAVCEAIGVRRPATGAPA